MKSVTYQGYKNMEVCEVNGPIEIITHAMPLEDVKEAYDIFDQKKDNTIKVILKPQYHIDKDALLWITRSKLRRLLHIYLNFNLFLFRNFFQKFIPPITNCINYFIECFSMFVNLYSTFGGTTG